MMHDLLLFKTLTIAEFVEIVSVVNFISFDYQRIVYAIIGEANSTKLYYNGNVLIQ